MMHASRDVAAEGRGENRVGTYAKAIFDADNHMYETKDALLRYLPEQYRSAIRFVEVEGRTRIALQNRITDYIPNPTFEVVAAPGTFGDFYAARNTEGRTLRQMAGDPIRARPEFREPAPRLALMDEQGIEKALMYPTLANLVEQRIENDPELVGAVIHSLNRWMLDTWTFDYKGRIFATPVLTLGIVEAAIDELNWVLENGARAVLIRPEPAFGYRGSRSFGLPEFDPFWREVQRAGVPVCFHAADTIIEAYVNLWEPPGASQSAFGRSPFRMMAEGHRDIEDTIASLVCHGTLSRFPDLRLASVENGTGWLPHLMENLDRVAHMMPQEFSGDPLEQLRRSFYFNPFWEDDLRQLIELVGADRVLFGSDYPHPEGLAEPRDYLQRVDGLDAGELDLVMHDNATALLGLAATA